MATSTEIKQRANALADKTDVNSITPKEVGGIMYDLASHSENVLRNGGTLGIRKVYESVSAIATSGLTAGATGSLSIPAQLLIIVYMYFGRVGVLTISIGFLTGNRVQERFRYAETNLLIG